MFTPYVTVQIESLTAQQKMFFDSLYEKRKLSKGIAYGLLLVSCHYLYLGKYLAQVLFWLTFGGIFIWWAIDIARLNGVIDDLNNDIAGQIAREVKAM